MTGKNATICRIFVGLGFAAGGLSSLAMAAELAGSVSFVAGEAQVGTADGKSAPLAIGAKVNAGEVITTGVGGHVYVNMVDGAFIVVRPQSRLRVEDYHYDPATPANNRIKFVLEEGVVRSVTGRAGQAAKQNYRLNTPLAAIGIRGTDFVVQAAPGVTRVSVQTGAIVMSPLTGDCLASTLGPCHNAATRVLTAAMSDAYLELRNRNEAPRLVPGEKAIEAPNVVAPPRPEEPRPTADKQSKTSADGDSRDAVREVNAGLIQNNVNVQGSNLNTPPVVVVEPAPQFWWGRWSSYVKAGDPGSFTSIATPGRELAGGNLVFGMMREEGKVVMPDSGTVNFKLAGSEAYIVQAGKTLAAAQVTSPTLKIDFGARRYDTALTLKANDYSPIAIQSSGAISWQGIFEADPGASNVALQGMLSKTSEQAGYVFQRELSNGAIAAGATRWTR
jgi:hypothetical protein